MPGTATKAITTKSSKKLERAVARKDANSASQRAATAYFDQIGQAVFQAYLQKECPDADPLDIPLQILADAKTLTTAATVSAAKHIPPLIEAIATAAVLAYQHTKGAKTGDTRKLRAGGRKPDLSPWKVEARRFALFTPRIDPDAAVERLVARCLISLDDEVVSVLDDHGNVTARYGEPEFKKKLSGLMGRARSKNFSGK